MNPEDRTFLCDLSEEMRNQDTFATRKPVFWVVTEERPVRDIEEGGLRFLVDSQEYSAEEFEEYLADHAEDLGLDEEQIQDLSWDIYFYGDSPYVLALEWKDRLEGVEIYGIRKERKPVQNTFFLTRKACLQHIEENAHHYINPAPYCCHAWRSPEVERLFTLIENIDWQQIPQLLA